MFSLDAFPQFMLCMPYIIPFVPVMIIVLVAILEVIFDRHKPPLKMPALQKAEIMRAVIAILSGLLIVTYFMPWARLNVGFDGFKPQVAAKPLFGLLDTLSRLGGFAEPLGASDSPTAGFYLFAFLFFLILLAITTIILCLHNSRNLYRWIASCLLPSFSMIPFFIVMNAVRSGDLTIGSINPGVGAILSGGICILIWIVALIDIVLHASECKWLLLYHLCYPVIALLTALLVVPFGFSINLLQKKGMGILDEFAFIILTVNVFILTLTVLYFIAGRWKREGEESTDVLQFRRFINFLLGFISKCRIKNNIK